MIAARERQRAPREKQRSCLSSIITVLLALLASEALAQIEVVDDRGNTVILERPAQRIVSLSPHITEMLFAAGAGERIVATVLFSDFPEAAKEIPVIGSHNAVAYESLLAANPDLVIAWASGNGDEIIARLKSLGLTVYLDEPTKIEDIPRSLQRIGTLVGREEITEREAAVFTKTLNALRIVNGTKPPVNVFYQIWNDPITTLNGKHLVSDVIRLCGGKNIFADVIPIAPVVNLESVLTANPDVIVVSGMDEKRPEWLNEWSQWTNLAATKNGQLHFIPPDLLQRNSLRIMQGAEMLCGILDSARATR
jgi:iron complex transport system substrate-binding protein